MNRLSKYLALLALIILPAIANAQIAVLNGSSDKLQVVLAGAKSTADATVTTVWNGNGGPATSSKTTNGVTAVDLITGSDGAPPVTINTISVSNTDTAAITLTIRRNNGTTYPIVNAVVLQVNDTMRITIDGYVLVVDSSGNQRGTANASTVRTGQTFKVNTTPKVGTTSGWTVGAANNLGTIATVAQSQSSSTLVVRLDGLHVGDTITGFSVYSSINSAGNTVTLDANLRKMTIAAGATATDASVASITQVSVTAATASTATKGSLTEVVAAGTQYYVLLTCTTGATTTLELDAVEFTVTSS